VGLRDLDSRFGQLKGLLAPVDRHDRLKVSGDEGQKSRPHHADHHHDDDREPQHHSSLRATAVRSSPTPTVSQVQQRSKALSWLRSWTRLEAIPFWQDEYCMLVQSF